MGSKTDMLISKGLIQPPSFLKNNVFYECIMGSVAYGCSNDNSDIDLYGFCIPPKDVIFPHLAGVIHGFGRQNKNFEQFQKHHILDKDSGKEYDITIYNIVKYFQLAMTGSPNVIDSLFVPRRCVLHSTLVGEHVRENRHLFLSKKLWYTLKGYAFSQMNKCRSKSIRTWVELCKKYGWDLHVSIEELEENLLSDVALLKRSRQLIGQIETSGKRTKRMESVAEHGCDLKFAYHVVRLLGEIEQVLMEHDLDLERNREQLKSIRRGEWSLDRIEAYFESKERELESLQIVSDLRHSPDESAIKTLLLECLEMHYGNLDADISMPDKAVEALRQIQTIADSTLQRMT